MGGVRSSVTIQFLRPRTYKLSRISQGWNSQCVFSFVFLVPFSGNERTSVKLSRKQIQYFFFSCIQLVPSLFGHEHIATVNNKNSIMFSLNFCCLAAMTKIILQLSFTTGIHSQSLAATLLWGAAAQEYLKQESDRARCYQESLSEVRELENSKLCSPKRMGTPTSNPHQATNDMIFLRSC